MKMNNRIISVMTKNHLVAVLFAGFVAAMIGLFVFSAGVYAQQSATGSAPTAPQGSVTSGAAKEEVCKQLDTLGSGSCASGQSNDILQGVVKPVVQTLTIIVGAVSVVVMVVGGLMYVLSAGDANNVKRAKDTIMYAAIGLIVALIAQTIVSFVIGAI